MNNQYIQDLSVQKKSVGKRLYAAVCLVLVASVFVSTASFAWLSLSQMPEMTGAMSRVGANGNLEIALGKNIGESAIGDSFDKNKVTDANRTWGNLIDLSDTSYGLEHITLRPVILNSAGGAVNTLHPLAYPIYGPDGRIDRIYANNVFAGTFNGTWFTSTADDYGVRGIGAAPYIAPGIENTFGPLSQRQEIYYDACYNLSSRMSVSYTSLCASMRNVLMAYCRDNTGVAASDLNLNLFSQKVDEIVAAINEDLRWSFTFLAAAEATPADNYFIAMDLLKEDHPDYEAIRPLVSDAIQKIGGLDVGFAISELRTFQNVSAQLKQVIASDYIDGNDGYSKEEIAQTVGLIFDLETTSFVADGEADEKKNYKFYSSVIPGLLYHEFTYKDWDGWRWSSNFTGSWVYDLNQILYLNKEHQDNASRKNTAAYVYAHFAPIAESLRLEDLDQAIIGLYISHWSYWESRAEEYQALLDEISALEAGFPATSDALADKQVQLQQLLDEEIYASDDSRLESIRSIMVDTIEAMRKYTLWSIAYYACDGQIPDDAYHRMQELANSSTYVHPRTAYQTLCNYGVKPVNALTQMVDTYDKLEKELLFSVTAHSADGMITWAELENELQRLLGTITHRFHFSGKMADSDAYYDHDYTVESGVPVGVMKKMRKELEACETAIGHTVTEDNVASWIDYGADRIWADAIGLFDTFHGSQYGYRYAESTYTLEDRLFRLESIHPHSRTYRFEISVGIGSEDNFNESGLTVRQTHFQNAQESIAYYQNQLISSAVNAEKDMVTLLMQIIAGESSVSLETISDYLASLQQQIKYGEGMLYQATLAMAASDFSKDSLYDHVYSGSAPKNVAGMITLLQNASFDENVMTAFAQRMALLNEQKALLLQAETLLKAYQNPQTGALTTTQIPTGEAVALLNPVLDTSSMILYGYAEAKQDGDPNEMTPPSYSHIVLYQGFGSPAVQINGRQATIGGGNPITIFGEVYLRLGRSLSGSLLTLAKSQVETYTAPTGSVSAEDIVRAEDGKNQHAYAMGTGNDLYTLNLCTEDAPYALATDLWTYTGNTEYISANNVLFGVYGYCIDLSFRTNAVHSDLLLQTEAANRVNSDDETMADTFMGTGSYMEFTIDHPSYTLDQAKEYMSCIRVAITDTKTGYIYGYAVLDIGVADVVGSTIKAPLRLCDQDTGILLEGDASQYICHLDQSVEKNLTVYVYLDGAKTSNALVSAFEQTSLTGALNLQFSSSAELTPFM